MGQSSQLHKNIFNHQNVFKYLDLIFIQNKS